MAPEFSESLAAPSQMIPFFGCSLKELFPEWFRPGNKSLAMIERLGCDFAGMVDTHTSGCMPAFLIGKGGLGDGGGWRCAAGRMRVAGQCPKGIVQNKTNFI